MADLDREANLVCELLKFAALARPAQRRCRVPSRPRVQQRFEGPPESWLRPLNFGSSGAGSPNPTRRYLPRGDLAASFRIVSRARSVADETNASPPDPTANDSAAASCRGLRSSSAGAIAVYLQQWWLPTPGRASHERNGLDASKPCAGRSSRGRRRRLRRCRGAG